MASRSDVERLVSANRGVSELIEAALNDLWSSLDVTKPEAAVSALLGELPTLVAQYGDVAAVVAGDWYDELRAESSARGRFAAVLADTVPAVKVESQIRFGAQHLFGADPAQALAFLSVALDKYVLQPGRDTIALSAMRDPAKPRVTRMVSATACDYCREQAASGETYTYHGHCNCAPAPSWR